ncbi:hypothetical protein ColLi_02005 [Colletotrichum liriopes]|uniref:CENP-V/GFA domain-containing protein n=1 Tax=Colletotrichum liriopes TaxID=708192 RepID=A0AA37LPF1_9PEZI|nr:hypothetical protein ColLi_02005 [Colletotrichum liriopes]
MTASKEQEPKRTYRGNCHCAAFVYEFDLPRSRPICTKKGSLWVIPARDNFRVVKGAESELSSYKFGTKQMIHKFCGNCGTAIMVDAPDGPPYMMVLNARSIQDLDIVGLERRPFNGAALGSKYEPPAHKGPNPTAEVEGASSILGAAIAARKPIDETYEDTLIECNCSICERNAYIWLKPNVDQVVLSGDDDKIGRYTFSHRILAKTFCKTCGVPLTNQFNPLTEEERNALTEDARYWHNWSEDKHPVNARVLNGVDLKSLKTLYVDGKTEHQPAYVNP